MILILLILLFPRFSVSYDLDPKSGKVEVKEHGSYEIGIDDYGELSMASCSFYSDTGINVTFPIGLQIGSLNTSTDQTKPDLFTNIVTNRGEEQLCKIIVSKVDDHGPNIWKLVTYDDIEGRNITETFYITFFHSAVIVNYGIRILEGESLFNHLQMGNKSLVSCVVKYNNTEFSLDLNTEKKASDRISSLGRSLCGFKLENVSRALHDGVYYDLSAVDDKGLHYRQTFDVRVNARNFEGNLYQRRWIKLGEELKISCFGSLFCMLFNPDGVLVSETCPYTVKIATRNHLGKWKCYGGEAHCTLCEQYTIELFKMDHTIIDVWHNETNEYLNIGCQLANSTSRFKFCKITAPNGHITNVLNFVASDRYTAIGTNLQNRICQLQIKKPLMDSEVGLWKCEFEQEYKGVSGSYLHVNSMAIPDYPKHTDITTGLNKSLTVTCQVPYYSEYCRIRAPNGTIYRIKNLLDIHIGKCQLTITNVTRTDNGTWSCLYARKTGIPDEEIKVDVTVAEILGYSHNIEADSGDRLTLSCSSGGIPLQYCRFISPLGVSYHLGNRQNFGGRIAYHGKGLEYGDCGIAISGIQKLESGEWKCAVKFINEIDDEFHEKELIGKISVDVLSPISRVNVGAIGIGSGVAILLIGVIIGVIFIKKWKQRQHSANSTNPERDNLTN